MKTKTLVKVTRYRLTNVSKQVAQVNPRRIALHCSVVNGSNTGGNQVVLTYEVPGTYTFVVPAGITVLDYVKCWGSGGHGTEGGDGSAGGGGGGGAYSETDNVNVATSQNATIVVDAESAGGLSEVTLPSSGAIVAIAQSGTPSGGAPTGGTGGLASGGVGDIKYSGGNGGDGDGIGLSAGGGGGSAGSSGNGGVGGNPSPGTAGGGGGAIGGVGANGAVLAAPGSSPGAGGGGGIAVFPSAGIGADGKVIIAYTVPIAGASWSLSQDAGLIVGKATWNFFGACSFFLCLDQHNYTDQITEQFFAISDHNGCDIEITEIISECELPIVEGAAGVPKITPSPTGSQVFNAEQSDREYYP